MTASEEITRLRALLKRAERAGSCCQCNVCPWCGVDPEGYDFDTGKKKGHTKHCDAFTPEGEPR